MTTRKIHEHDAGKLVTISVQLPARWALLIHQAAAKVGAKSTARFAGQAMLNKACDELGLDRQDIDFLKAMATAERADSYTAASFMRAAVRPKASRTSALPALSAKKRGK